MKKDGKDDKNINSENPGAQNPSQPALQMIDFFNECARLLELIVRNRGPYVTNPGTLFPVEGINSDPQGLNAFVNEGTPLGEWNSQADDKKEEDINDTWSFFNSEDLNLESIIETKAPPEGLESLSNVLKKNDEWVLHKALDHLLVLRDYQYDKTFFVSEQYFQYLFPIIDSAEHIINLKKSEKDSKDDESVNTVIQRLAKYLTHNDPPAIVVESISTLWRRNYAYHLFQMLIIKDVETQLNNFSKRISSGNPMARKSIKWIDFTHKLEAYFQVKQRLASIIDTNPDTLNFNQYQKTCELILKLKIDSLLEANVRSMYLRYPFSVWNSHDYETRKLKLIHLLSIYCAIMLNQCNAARQVFLKASETVFNRQSDVFNAANQISPLSSLILPNDEGDSVLTLLFQHDNENDPMRDSGEKYTTLYFNQEFIGEIILDDLSVSDYLKKCTLTLCSLLFSYEDEWPTKAYMGRIIAYTLCQMNHRLYYKTRHEERFLNPDRYEYVPLNLMKKVYSLMNEKWRGNEQVWMEDGFVYACLAKSINGRNKQNFTHFQKIFNLYSKVWAPYRQNFLKTVFNKQDSALCAAIQNKYIDAINYFLDLISNYKLVMTCAAGWQWFSLAIEADDPGIVSSLLSFLQNSPIDNLNYYKNAKTKKTILDLGLENNNSKIIDLLVAAGFEKSIVPIFTPPPPVRMLFPDNKREVIKTLTSSSSEDSKRASTDSDNQHSESPDTSMTLFPSPHNKKRKQSELESKQEVSESSSQSQNKCSRTS